MGTMTIEQRITDETPALCGRWRSTCAAYGIDFEDFVADVQTIALNALRSESAYDDNKGAFSTWMYHLSRNKLYKIIRNEATRIRNYHNFSYTRKEEKHDEALQRLTTQEIITSLEKLDARTASFIRSYFFEDKTYKDIGLSQNPPITIERVRQIICDGLSTIRHKF